MASSGGTAIPVPGAAVKRKKPFYRNLWGQVLIGVGVGIALGYFWPDTGAAMRPLGDAFIRLITMIIALVVFCTIVTGIAGMGDMKRVGRVGGKALLYFETVSNFALVIGLVVGNVVRPGAGFDAAPSEQDAAAVAGYAGRAQEQSATEFLLNIIPDTVVDAFASGNILSVVLISLLFGFALSSLGHRSKPLVDFIEAVMQAVFGVVGILMKFAPIGAFGAMAFTVGRFGIDALLPLARLIFTFWITSILFVILVLGAIAWMAGFSILKFLAYIKEEIVLTLSLSSSEPALPTLMSKMEKLGCSKALVGLVVPTGYAFNTDGSCLYITMAALFVAQATNTPLTLMEQLAIFGVAVLTSNGASGVQGASFIALVGTLMVVGSPTLVAGMALILGVDRFMSMFRATVNVIGNGVAAVVLARWEGELDRKTLQENLAAGPLAPAPAGQEAPGS